MPANTKIDQKLSMISKYLYQVWVQQKFSLRLDDRPHDLDIQNGWDNPHGEVPQHLFQNGYEDRYLNYRAGQEARKLRNNDKTTIIVAQEKEYSENWVSSYKGTLSHRQIVRI